MENKDSFETINIPEIKTADISYWYSNEVLKWWQIDASNNRQISKVQYFAFKVNCTWWTIISSYTTSTLFDIIYTGFNGDIWKTFNTAILWSPALISPLSGTITKSYTIDTSNENNITWIPQEIVVPIWKVCEVTFTALTSTQIVQLTDTSTAWFILLSDFSSVPINLTQSAPRVTFMWGSSINNLYFKLRWASTTNSLWLITERPSFWIFIKIY